MSGALELNINATEIVKFTNKLEALSSTALPNVVRKTLNAVAMDVKKKTLPKTAGQNFETRNKTFFKRGSRVNFASGKRLQDLVATVGMSENGIKGRDAISNLEAQERGGTISRTYIPTDKARVSGSRGRAVQAKNRLKKVKAGKVIKTKESKGANWAQRAIKASLAAGVGGYVEDWNSGRSGLIWRVNSIRRTGRGIRFKRTDIFYINKSGKVRVKDKNVARKAATEAYKKLGNLFMYEAEKRFKRALK
tara:strand:+ start:31 stop:780 length:750 start_codon:yes stop_codon:yes gene_type:complete